MQALTNRLVDGLIERQARVLSFEPLKRDMTACVDRLQTNRGFHFVLNVPCVEITDEQPGRLCLGAKRLAPLAPFPDNWFTRLKMNNNNKNNNNNTEITL